MGGGLPEAAVDGDTPLIKSVNSTEHPAAGRCLTNIGLINN